MKKAITRNSTKASEDELSDEYHFDYRKAKPNRFASRAESRRLLVALDSDVSQVFTTPESVNRMLRALISTMPQTRRRKARK
jgi:hypothetical protein